MYEVLAFFFAAVVVSDALRRDVPLTALGDTLGALTLLSCVFSCRDSADAPEERTELFALGLGVTTGTVPDVGNTPALEVGVGRTTPAGESVSPLIMPPGATNEAAVTNTAMPAPTAIFLPMFISGSNLEGA